MEIAPALPPSTNSAAPPDRDSGRADDPLLALFAGLLVQAGAQGGAPPSGGAAAQTPETGAAPRQAPLAQVQALSAACQPPAAAGPDVPHACPAFGRGGEPVPAPPAAGAERSTKPLAPGAPKEAGRTPLASGSGDGPPAMPEEALLDAAARTSVPPEPRAAKDAAVRPPAGADARAPQRSASDGRRERA